MIAVRSLAKSYGERQVLSDVDLDLPAGGVIGLVGANGAGKSTLLSVMARLLGADAGTVEVGGLNVATAPGRQLATVLSVLKQDNHHAVRLTVRDLVGSAAIRTTGDVPPSTMRRSSIRPWSGWT